MADLQCEKCSYLSSVASSLRELLCARDVLAFRNIRRGQLKYFFSFPLAMIFVNVQNVFLVDHSRVFALPATTITFLSFVAGAILFFSCCKEQNIASVSRVAAYLTLAGAIPWVFLPTGGPALFCALALMAGIGGCVSCSSFSFVFVLNNTERFFGSALMLLVISLVELAAGLALISPPIRKGFAFVLVIILFLCMVVSRQEDYAGKGEKSSGSFDRSVWLALFVFFSYFSIRITGFYVPAFQHPSTSQLWSVLAIIPVLLCIAAQVVFKRSIWTLCNVFFLSAILSYVMWYVELPESAHFFSELKEIGFLVTFYLIGCVTNKFCDFRMHKRLILLCMAVVGLLYLGIDLLQIFMPGQPVAVITAAVLFGVFLLLSPAFSQHLFFADWSKELRSIYMTVPACRTTPEKDCEPQMLTLENTSLSPREKQVVLLLLKGMTLRQVAPELGLTASTVATYSKTIYKKLGINSRAELFLMFGQPRSAKQTDNTFPK